MNQTLVNKAAYICEVSRLTSRLVRVQAIGYSAEGLSLQFTVDTSRVDTPKVNDDILVTITTPAPELAE